MNSVEPASRVAAAAVTGAIDNAPPRSVNTIQHARIMWGLYARVLRAIAAIGTRYFDRGCHSTHNTITVKCRSTVVRIISIERFRSSAVKIAFLITIREIVKQRAFHPNDGGDLVPAVISLSSYLCLYIYIYRSDDEKCHVSV